MGVRADDAATFTLSLGRGCLRASDRWRLRDTVGGFWLHNMIFGAYQNVLNQYLEKKKKN